MPKIFPITYSRYSRALARRLSPADFAPVAYAKPSSSKKTAVKKASPPIKTEYVSLPRRVPTPEAFSPRVESFGYPELLSGIENYTTYWYLDDQSTGVLRVISPSKDSHSLLNSVLATAYENGFEVQVVNLRTGERIAANVRKCHELLRLHRRLNLRLVDQRSSSKDLKISVESWSKTPEGHLSSPQNNATLSRIWKGTLDNQLSKLAEVDGIQNIATDLNSLLPARVADEVDFDIDWVFSWVNGDDPDWKELFNQWAPDVDTDAVDKSRFETRDDLKYALRSLEEYAPWVRTIHVLTNCKAPEWLDLNNSKIHWVDHSEVFEDEFLPTFSSHAIETVLHKIPNLSDHFVYSNDDFFLMKPARKSDFFYSNGIARLRLENYGMVNGPTTVGEPDYLNAARNSASLLVREFGAHPVRLHTHSPQSMNKNVLSEMENKFQSEFLETRANKFRHSTDIAVTGFLYHHFAYLTGRAVPDGGNTRLIQQNHNFVHLFNTLLQEKNTGKLSKFLSVCVNDGRGSADNPAWGKSALAFVNGYFPDPSQFEHH